MIWVWIALAVALTALLLKGKNIAPYNFIWALLPIDNYGPVIFGFTLKPMYIYSVIFVAFAALTKRYRLRLSKSAFISTVAYFALMFSVSLLRGSGFISDIRGYYAVFLVTVICAAAMMSFVEGPDDFRQVEEVLIAAAVGFGTVFIVLTALYNLGRVISYAAVGGACGALGRIISYDAAFKSMLFTMCGALVVLIGLRMWGVPFLRRLSAQLRRPCELPQDVRRKTLGRPLLIGIATGLMPCGALSAMWLYSAASGSAAKGAASMLVFALGTVPAMLLFGALGSMIPKKYNKYILKCSTVLIVSLGLVLMIKGIRLV